MLTHLFLDIYVDTFMSVKKLLNNTNDHGDTCNFFISLIIKVGVMITPFRDWFKIIILRVGEHYFHMIFSPNYILATSELKNILVPP